MEREKERRRERESRRKGEKRERKGEREIIIILGTAPDTQNTQVFFSP